MPREPMRPEPYLKHMMSYRQFDGLNTVDSEHQMTDAEVLDLVNVDLGERGSFRRRHGIKHHQRELLWGDIGSITWGQLDSTYGS